MAKVRTGDRIQLRAEFLNKTIDLVNAPSQAVAPTLSGKLVPGLIQVKNVSGGSVGVYSVMGVGDTVLDPVDDELNFKTHRPVVEIDKPDTDQDELNFCILTQALEDDEVGNAWYFGMSPVQIDILDEAHEYARIKDGDETEMESSPFGRAKIISRGEGADSDGLGTAWAWVHLGIAADVPLLIKIDEIIEESTGDLVNIKMVDIDGNKSGPVITFPKYNG